MVLNTELVREDFPVLHQLKDGKPIIYADSACMSLKPNQVINAIMKYYKEFSACGGRSPHTFAMKTTKLCDDARKDLAKFINAKNPTEVVWTKNTTEALNLGSRFLKYDGTETIIASSDNHNSNLVKWVNMKKLGKINLEIINRPFDGSFNLEEFTEIVNRCNEGKFLTSLTHINNITGTRIPLEEIVKIVHEKNGIIQLDAAQSFPYFQLDVQDMDVDLLAVSMHKACGPTGMGFLYGKHNLLQEVDPLILGGETVSDLTLPDNIEYLKPPHVFEAGLQNYAGIIASGAAVNYLKSVGMDNIAKYEKELSKTLMEGLMDNFKKKVNIFGPEDPNQRIALAALDLKGIDPHKVAILLDKKNIFLRSGFHCAHAYHHALGLNEGTLRPSWYLYNTAEEIDIFIETLKEILDKMT